MLGPEPPRDVLHQAAVRSDRRPMHDSFMARQAALLVNTWELALIERPDGQALTPDKPARYTLRLVEDGGPPIGIVCPGVRGSAPGRPNIRDPSRRSVGLGAPAVPHPEVHCHSASPMVTAAAVPERPHRGPDVA